MASRPAHQRKRLRRPFVITPASTPPSYIYQMQQLEFRLKGLIAQPLVQLMRPHEHNAHQAPQCNLLLAEVVRAGLVALSRDHIFRSFRPRFPAGLPRCCAGSSPARCARSATAACVCRSRSSSSSGAARTSAAPAACSTGAPGTRCRPPEACWCLNGVPAPASSGRSVAHRFAVGGHKGYEIAAAQCDPSRPVHIEIRMAKEGGVLRGLLVCPVVSVCLGLDRGVPLSAYTDALVHVRFEPSGHTPRRYAHSIVDYVFRWLRERFPAASAPPESAPGAIKGETCSVCGTPSTCYPDGQAHAPRRS